MSYGFEVRLPNGDIVLSTATLENFRYIETIQTDFATKIERNYPQYLWGSLFYFKWAERQSGAFAWGQAPGVSGSVFFNNQSFNPGTLKADLPPELAPYSFIGPEVKRADNGDKKTPAFQLSAAPLNSLTKPPPSAVAFEPSRSAVTVAHVFLGGFKTP